MNAFVYMEIKEDFFSCYWTRWQKSVVLKDKTGIFFDKFHFHFFFFFLHLSFFYVFFVIFFIFSIVVFFLCFSIFLLYSSSFSSVLTFFFFSFIFHQLTCHVRVGASAPCGYTTTKPR